MKQSIITFLILVNAICINFAQHANNGSKKFGIETNLVWPFTPSINIWQVKFTPVISRSQKTSTELIVGLLYRNTSDDPNAAVHKEIGGTLGIRHFFYKGFHAEVVAHITSASEEKNKVDGKDYTGLAITPEFYTGYRFEFKKANRTNFYLIPQVGFGKNVLANIGPETEKSAVFPVLSLLAGIRF